MEFLSILVDNYKATTQGLNIVVKVIVAMVLAFIVFTVISAFINVIFYGV